jgi:hypothetical protein
VQHLEVINRKPRRTPCDAVRPDSDNVRESDDQQEYWRIQRRDNLSYLILRSKSALVGCINLDHVRPANH